MQGGKERLEAYFDKQTKVRWQDKASGLHFDKLANAKWPEKVRGEKRRKYIFFFTMKPTPPWLTRLRLNTTYNDLFSDLGYDF
jgi:hypothetical protein